MPLRLIREAALLPWTLISFATSRVPDPFDNDFARRQIAAAGIDLED